MYKTLVSFDGSPFSSFFLFLFLFVFSSSKICGNVFAGQSSKMGNFCWKCAEDNLGSWFCFVFFLQDRQISISLLIFSRFFCAPVSLLWHCKGGILPPSTCCILWYFFLFGSLNHFFHVSSVKSQFKVVCPSPPVRLLIHFHTKPPFAFSWRGTECKPEHTRSQESNCLLSRSGTKSISLPFGLCTFCPPKRWTLALGPGPERTEDERRLLHCVLWGWFLLTLLG